VSAASIGAAAAQVTARATGYGQLRAQAPQAILSAQSNRAVVQARAT